MLFSKWKRPLETESHLKAPEVKEFILPAGERLDHFLVEFLEHSHSRSQLQKAIHDGQVTLDGAVVNKNGTKVKTPTPGKIALVEPEEYELKPVNLDLEILFQDSDLAVIHKPPGITVHPGINTGNDTLVHGLLAAIASLAPGFSAERPGLVHRLDRDTEGVMVVAKNARSHTNLSAQFQNREIAKEYLAIIWGQLRVKEQRMVGFISRHEKERRKMKFIRDEAAEPYLRPDTADSQDEKFQDAHEIMQQLKKSGDHHITGQVGHSYQKAAALSYEVIDEKGDFSRVKIQLETGRTHQIRATFASLGHPVAGDQIYGDEHRLIKRFHLGKKKVALLPDLGLGLLARKLGFVHPTSGEELSFEIPVPERFETFWNGI